MNFSTILGTINFLKGLNNPDKDKIVSNLADTFFYALKNTLSNFDEEDKTTTFQIKEMISLEKKEIISLINDLIKTENSSLASVKPPVSTTSNFLPHHSVGSICISLVTPASSLTTDFLVRVKILNNVDLPTFGRPIIATLGVLAVFLDHIT